MPRPPSAILVVDDDAGDIQLLHRALSAVGCDAVLYAVQSADLAERFLARSDAFAAMPSPDLVVLDLRMPEASGYEVLMRIRADERWRSIPVAILTLEADESARERCLSLGADDFQMKPADEAGYRRWAESLRQMLDRHPVNKG